MAPRFNIYSTEHIHSQNVCAAFAKGTGFPVVSASPLRAGGVVMYGFLRGLLPTLREARKEGRPWVYVDRGYFRSTRGGDYSGYFRVTRGALQHDGRGTFDRKRWDNLLVPMAPWRRQGKHILVCPPGDVWLGAFGEPFATTQKQWVAKVITELERHTDRPIRIRTKPNFEKAHKPLIEDLQDCHALVTHMSNTAVESVLAGVPVYCLAPCAGATMGQRDLAKIETPVYPDREAWAAALAANQWTLDEIRAGKANHLFI